MPERPRSLCAEAPVEHSLESPRETPVPGLAEATPARRARGRDRPAPAPSPAVDEKTVYRLLLADDHQVMRAGLNALLSVQPDIVIVDEADNGLQAVELVERHRPDVVIMDISMPVMNGIEATRVIKRRWPEVRVIALSMFDESEMSRRMLEAGAEAYVSKTGASRQLLAAIRTPRPG